MEEKAFIPRPGPGRGPGDPHWGADVPAGLSRPLTMTDAPTSASPETARATELPPGSFPSLPFQAGTCVLLVPCGLWEPGHGSRTWSPTCSGSP